MSAVDRTQTRGFHRVVVVPRDVHSLVYCLNALSVKCALISPYVIMQMNFEICDTVPQQRSSAAVVA